MSNTIIPGLLNDTYNLVQLARESALVQGKASQASKLTPVVDDLKNLVKTSNQPIVSTKPTGVLAAIGFPKIIGCGKGSSRQPKINEYKQRC